MNHHTATASTATGTAERSARRSTRALDTITGQSVSVAAALPILLLPLLLGVHLLDRGRARVTRVTAGVDRDRTAKRGRDVGQSIVEWVVLVAIVVTATIAVGAIIMTRVTDKANELDLTTP